MRPDIKKRREKYENVITPAMRLFGGKDLILERKVGMNIAHYKYMRRIQVRALKMLFKRPADPQIARMMVPYRNPWLEYQVSLKKAIKEGRIEEVKPIESWFTNLFTNIFNYLRKAYGVSSIPATTA
jgi:hypothetical protein